MPSIKYYIISKLEESAENGLFQLQARLPNGVQIEWAIAEDGFVNCTKICKAFGKDINEWKKNKSSLELMEAYKKVIGGILPDGIYRVIQGGNNKFIRGSYYPPDIAIQILQWCDPYFALYVSRTIRELMLTGKVDLGNQKSIQELDIIWKQRVEELKQKCLEIETERDTIKLKLLDTETALYDKEKELQIKTIQLEKTKQKQRYPTLNSGYCFI